MKPYSTTQKKCIQLEFRGRKLISKPQGSSHQALVLTLSYFSSPITLEANASRKGIKVIFM